MKRGNSEVAGFQKILSSILYRQINMCNFHKKKKQNKNKTTSQERDKASILLLMLQYYIEIIFVK